MTSMGNVSLVLGMQITRNREAGTLKIGQEHHTKSILPRFGWPRCNPVHPTWAGAELSLDQPDDTLLDPTATKLYKSITRFRMLLSQYTRFDITYAVNQLARVMSKPSKLHVTATRRLLRYLKGNMSLVIIHQIC